MVWTSENVQQMWSILDQNTRYSWPVYQRSWNELEKLVGALPRQLFDCRHVVATRALREHISHSLRCGSKDTKETLATWIISNWGGIKANLPERISGYLAALGDFSEDRVSDFVKISGTKGISSWSKLLSFAYSDRYAIYNSRTAVALNCALKLRGHGAAFVMPLGKAKVTVSATSALRNHMRQCNACREVLGYNDYMSLLRRFVEVNPFTGPADVLEAEMVIFANSPVIAKKFLSQHNQ